MAVQNAAMRRQTGKMPSRTFAARPQPVGLSAHMLEAEDEYEDDEEDEGLNPTEAARRAVQRPRRDEAAEVCLLLPLKCHALAMGCMSAGAQPEQGHKYSRSGTMHPAYRHACHEAAGVWLLLHLNRHALALECVRRGGMGQYPGQGHKYSLSGMMHPAYYHAWHVPSIYAMVCSAYKWAS